MRVASKCTRALATALLLPACAALAVACAEGRDDAGRDAEGPAGEQSRAQTNLVAVPTFEDGGTALQVGFLGGLSFTERGCPLFDDMPLVFADSFGLASELRDGAWLLVADGGRTAVAGDGTDVAWGGVSWVVDSLDDVARFDLGDCGPALGEEWVFIDSLG